MFQGNETILGQFVHPGLAWAGVGLATVPIIIHILNRRRYRKMDWAAMEFLLAAHKRSVRRLRLEQLLLLFLRCLVIALLGAGLARPFVSAWGATGLGQFRRHHVLMIDNSMSTTCPGDEKHRVFDEIKHRAVELLDAFSSGDTVTVITLARPAAVLLEHGSYDRQVVRERIDSIRADYRATDLSGGFRLAKQVLERGEIPSTNRSVLVLTDNVRAAWLGASTTSEPGAGSGGARRAAELAREARLTILQFPPAEAGNVCIEEFSVGVHLVGTLLPTPFRLRVTNHDDRRAMRVRAQIRLDGRIVRELDVPPLDPRQSTMVHFRVQFDEPGTRNLEAVLVGAERDALVPDSRRYLTLDVMHSAKVLLVDGKPAATLFESQCGYLVTALAPAGARRTVRQIEPKVITDAELDSEVFSEYGVIMLCNVRRLAEDTWSRLAEYVQRGGGLVVFLGDNVLVDHYNQVGFADGAGALACRIGERAMTGAAADSAHVLFSGEDLAHPVVSEFTDQKTGSLFLARTRQYYTLSISAGDERPGAAIRTVLRFTNDDPAIVERLIGKGTSLLVTTTANMEWTNLPAKGDFVSLVWNLVGYAWPRGGLNRNLIVGAPLRKTLTPVQFAAANEFVRPDGERVAAEIVPDGDGFVAELAQTATPGFYAHEAAGASTSFACNVDPAESDLQPIDGASLRELIGARFELRTRRIPPRRLAANPAKRELAWNLLYMAYVLLLVEPLLAMWFGHHRS